MNRRFWICLCALCVVSASLSTSSSAEDADDTGLLAHIDAQLVRAPVIRADFEQARTMRVLKRPLVTRGEVTAVAERGVLWQLRDPHNATVLMTAGAVTEWDGTGEPRQLELASSPAFRVLSDSLLAVLTGSFSKLTDQFEIDPAMNAGQWSLAMTPRNASLGSIIERIDVSGSRFVESAVITEAAGDLTNITFSNHRTEPDSLGESELRYFEE